MKKTFIFLFILIAAAGCNLEEINENPNVPTDVPLSTLLPPAQKALADAQGGRMFRYTGIFAQQLTGLDNQELLVENYQPDEFFVDNPWSDLYLNSLLNLNIIIERADEASPHYAGMARILTAHGLGMLVDVWGDVPYTEAFQGAEIPHPNYNTQEQLYDVVFNLLNRGIQDLEMESSVFSPGSDDLIYGGDLERWIRAARVLQARFALRTLKRNSNAGADALAYLAPGAFSSVADDLGYTYLGTGDDTNPISGFFQNTPNTTMDPQFIALTQGLNDPRYPYITKSIPFSGGRRRPGDYYASPASMVRLVSYIEQEFIRAECLYRSGETTQAAQVLEDVVRVHMDEVSTAAITTEEADAYVAAQLQFTGSEGNDLRIILTQKWIALMTTPEPWADWRRTGWPALLPNENGTSDANPNGEIPRRLIYPQSERLRNNNFPAPGPTMQDRFWWDMP